MNQIFKCMYDGHTEEFILGFCLNASCQEKAQWCHQCSAENKHLSHSQEQLTFSKINALVKNYAKQFSDWKLAVQGEFEKVQKLYQMVTKFLENEKTKMIEFDQKLQEQNFQSFKADIENIKLWKLICETPTNVGSENQLSMLTKLSELISAIQIKQQVVQGIQQNKEIDHPNYFDQGMVHLQNRNLQEALQSFEEAIKLNDQNSKAWQYKDLGQILHEEQQYQMAINCFEMAIKIDPAYVQAFNSKGLSLQSLNQFEEAVRCFNVALTINPKLAILHYNKGLSYHNLNLFNDAIQSYNEAINIDQNFVLAYNNKGMSLHCSGRYDDAIKCYDQALSIDQKYAILFYNKGSALHSMNKFNEAISCYDQAIRISPQYALAYNNKGNSLCSLDRIEEAISCYNQAINIDSSYLIAQKNRSMVLEQQGKTPEPKIFNGRPIINK